MPNLRAETIAIGDELTSGVRLDTNTQWVSHQLESLGLAVGFQTTVADELASIASALEIAAARASVVVCTGGLGPTQDDLTRQALAQVGQVPLELDEEVLAQIATLFQSRGREMPPNNEIQAWFPVGARVIPNPDGTAPGIDYDLPASRFPTLEGAQQPCRVFALPGVPAEMKLMWQDTVKPAVKQWLGIEGTTVHHTLHCFGAGESAIEMMLPDLVRRGRDPAVGITASGATISLRVWTRAETEAACREKIAPTLELIRSTLGDLVFGENGQQLEDVVVAALRQRKQTLRVVDFGLRGEVARRLATADHDQQVLAAGHVWPAPPKGDMTLAVSALPATADLDVIIGSIDRESCADTASSADYQLIIRNGQQTTEEWLPYRGHPSWRESRAAKDVLNHLRLWIQRDAAEA